MLTTIVIGILIAAAIIWAIGIIAPALGLGLLALVAFIFGREPKKNGRPDHPAPLETKSLSAVYGRSTEVRLLPSDRPATQQELEDAQRFMARLEQSRRAYQGRSGQA